METYDFVTQYYLILLLVGGMHANILKTFVAPCLSHMPHNIGAHKLLTLILNYTFLSVADHRVHLPAGHSWSCFLGLTFTEVHFWKRYLVSLHLWWKFLMAPQLPSPRLKLKSIGACIIGYDHTWVQSCGWCICHKPSMAPVSLHRLHLWRASIDLLCACRSLSFSTNSRLWPNWSWLAFP